MCPKVSVSEFIMMYTLCLNLNVIYVPVIFGVILVLEIQLTMSILVEHQY